MAGLFETLFDPRRHDSGQRDALIDHDHDIADLDQDLRDLAAAVEASDDKVHQRVTKLKDHFIRLRERMYRIELVTEALFAHLENKGELDRDGLRTLMKEIDAADGKVDGRARKRRT